jgi:hypothetical protein
MTAGVAMRKRKRGHLARSPDLRCDDSNGRKLRPALVRTAWSLVRFYSRGGLKIRNALLPHCRFDAIFGKRVPGIRHIDQVFAILRSISRCSGEAAPRASFRHSPAYSVF